MREVRLSIPVIGGITVVYTREEVDQQVAKVKAGVASAVDKTRRGTQRLVRGLASNLEKLASKIDKPIGD